ncbi:DUF2252 domain-containing protein [Nocardioides sp. SR21]|uniref:DUF2252 domain-containing protein n=1 Tax=Nocardioides sp. SR21 TaxID=2919501 RepID=UPI001FAB0F86|nr:DUF2252 domain-containing protein [Nocardioides sp. SR21]
MVTSTEQEREDGRARRSTIPRSAHRDWRPTADRPDPVEVLQAANADRLPDLVPIRFGRMAASPFAFLRGSASVMAADLGAVPTTGLRVQASGDCHLMNFGLFATPERHVVFGLNDFDETMPGPWEWDVKRLAASFMVASQDVRLSDEQAREIAVTSVRSYRERIREMAAMSPLEVWYDRLDLEKGIEEAPDKAAREARTTLLKKARRRVAEDLYPKLIRDAGGGRGIKDQPPLIFHLDDVTPASVVPFVESYRSSLDDDRRVLFDRFEVEDVAIKVVGVGSVGTRCFVVLLRDHADRPLLLQVKEASDSVLAPYVGGEPDEPVNNGHRVVVGQRLMQPASDLFLGWGTAPTGRHFYIRQLRDMKLSVTLTGDVGRMTRYAEFCGKALARAHANSGSATAISAYLGSSGRFDDAIGEFAARYAVQTVEDHRALVAAIQDGRVEAIFETD